MSCCMGSICSPAKLARSEVNATGPEVMGELEVLLWNVALSNGKVCYPKENAGCVGRSHQAMFAGRNANEPFLSI